MKFHTPHVRLQNFCRQISDVAGDRVTGEELRQFIRESIAVVLQQLILVWSTNIKTKKTTNYHERA